MGSSKVFIRHPDEFPIELDIKESNSLSTTPPSLELVCHSDKAFHSGEGITLKIPSIAAQLEVNGTIQSCNNASNGYELGIAFGDNCALMRIRMLEQLCYIQRYRNHVLTVEGRDISDQDAALEWINKYAHLFPSSP